MLRSLSRAAPLIFCVALLAVTTGLGASGSDALTRTTDLMLINATLVIAVYIFAGNTGIFSFGHMAFAAIGGYIVGFLTIPTIQKELFLTGLPHIVMEAQWSAAPATLVAGVVAALIGGAIGWPIMRLSGISASIATFALLIVIHDITNNWQSVTGASQGIVGVPTTTTTGAALACAVLACIVAFAFQRSSIGLRLKATREDEIAARAIGISVVRERRIAFTLSAFFAGLGGALYAQLLGSFTPESFFLDTTFLVIAMLVVGGLRSLTGAVVGTVSISILAELLRRAEQGAHLGPWEIPHRAGMQAVGLALVMLVILLLRPDGLTRGREFRWRALGIGRLPWSPRGRSPLSETNPDPKA